jgi:hypothetical protein
VVEDSVTAESLGSRREGNHRREGEGQEQESQTTRVGGQTGASTRGLMSSYRMRNASSTSGSSSASATPWTMERIFASWIPAVVVANLVEIEFALRSRNGGVRTKLVAEEAIFSPSLAPRH